jgi:hypothetical protein
VKKVKVKMVQLRLELKRGDVVAVMCKQAEQDEMMRGLGYRRLSEQK